MSSPHSAKMMPTHHPEGDVAEGGEDVLGIEPVRPEGLTTAVLTSGGSSLGEIHPVRLSSRDVEQPTTPAPVGVGPHPGALAGRRTAGSRAPRAGRPAQRRRPVPVLAPRGDRRRPRRAGGIPSTSRSRTSPTTSTSGRWCARPTPSSRGRCTSSAGGAGIGAARWSPTATSTCATTRTPTALAAWAADAGLPLIGIDNLPGAVPIETAVLPRACVLLFGQEGDGLTPQAHGACASVLSIAQYGSTRSINAGAAAAIAMHAWIRQHEFGQVPTERRRRERQPRPVGQRPLPPAVRRAHDQQHRQRDHARSRSRSACSSFPARPRRR